MVGGVAKYTLGAGAEVEQNGGAVKASMRENISVDSVRVTKSLV